MGAKLGLALRPPGAMMSGFVGGIAGGVAESKIGEAVYEGGKVIPKTSANFLSNTYKITKEIMEDMWGKVNPLNWFSEQGGRIPLALSYFFEKRRRYHAQ